MSVDHDRLIEALLFASPDPLSERALAEKLPEGVEIGPILLRLQADYAMRGVNLMRFDGRWAFRTAPDLAAQMKVEAEVQRRLSRAAIETLAIVAYHQPVTRAEVEEIRGVAVSKGTMDILFEAGWIRPKGRRRTPGRPVTWVTTEGFLDHFGLEALADLPGVEELRAAGLLDARPSMAAYSNRAADDGPPVDVDEPLDIGEIPRPDPTGGQGELELEKLE
jgi:segregation and condensation protein B